MTQEEFISDEKLNALLDNELDSEERSQILSLMQENSEIAERYSALRRVKESVAVAYSNPPLPSYQSIENKSWKLSSSRMAIASAILLFTGSIIGWFGGIQMSQKSPDTFFSVAQLKSVELKNDKILIHISSMNPQKVEAALQTAEHLLLSNKDVEGNLKLEVVANVEGLGVLRRGSPYSEAIQQLSSNHKNISFKACGIAKKVAALKEGREITLLPQAEDIPAALDQILLRIKQGWIYVKG